MASSGIISCEPRVHLLYPGPLLFLSLLRGPCHPPGACAAMKWLGPWACTPVPQLPGFQCGTAVPGSSVPCCLSHCLQAGACSLSCLLLPALLAVNAEHEGCCSHQHHVDTNPHTTSVSASGDPGLPTHNLQTSDSNNSKNSLASVQMI